MDLDLWETDASITVVPRPETRTNDSDDEPEIFNNPPRRSSLVDEPIEVTEAFQGLDDGEDFVLNELPPDEDVEQLKRQAMAREKALDATKAATAAASASITPSTQKKKKARNVLVDDDGDDEEGESLKRKKRKAIPKLDEERLLGPHGFPALIKTMKRFKPKGKGHEKADLDKLLQMYQFWGHQMYPKTQFLDTVERVEKLTHSRRMTVALSVWKDQTAKGIEPGQQQDEDIHAAEDEPSHSGPSHEPVVEEEPAEEEPRRPRRGIVVDDEDDEAGWVSLMNGLSQSEVAPTTQVEIPNGVADEDAALWESFAKDSVDDDQSMWDELMASHSEPPTAPQNNETDEEMWDMFHKPDSTAPSLAPPDLEEDEDDLYA